MCTFTNVYAWHMFNHADKRPTTRQATAGRPWLAHLCFHAIHEPHPAMPQFYHDYANDPDYLGALTMWDVQVRSRVGGQQGCVTVRVGSHSPTLAPSGWSVAQSVTEYGRRQSHRNILHCRQRPTPRFMRRHRHSHACTSISSHTSVTKNAKSTASIVRLHMHAGHERTDIHYSTNFLRQV